jgi:rSAM/selenodomain-associated transferase 2
MTPGPRVSVVIPAWNEAERLPRLLNALERCKPAAHEVIVVDGGSDDGTQDRARSRARLIQAPRGRARQQNAGAREATGDVLWFLHADCVPAPSAVGEIRTVIASGSPGGCFLIAFPREERTLHPLVPWIERGINARTRVTLKGTGDQGIFARRDVFFAAGGFPVWPLFEDVALAAGLRRAGRPAVCPGPLETSARRWLRHGVGRTMALMWALRLAYLAGASPESLARRWRQAG